MRVAVANLQKPGSAASTPTARRKSLIACCLNQIAVGTDNHQGLHIHSAMEVGMSAPTHRSYSGAHAVAGVFKLASFLVIIGGVVTAVQISHDQSYVGNKDGIEAGIIAGTIFTAAAVAFFAYVLDLLIGIERNTFAGRSARPAEAPSPQLVTSAPSVASPPVPALGKPGWYSDPQGLARVRYWDGHAWTDQTQH
jgi:Protein of unknown function (DUF2510)